MGQPGLFSFIFGLFNQTSLQFFQQINVKKCHVHPVYGAGIRTRVSVDLSLMKNFCAWSSKSVNNGQTLKLYFERIMLNEIEHDTILWGLNLSKPLRYLNRKGCSNCKIKWFNEISLLMHGTKITLKKLVLRMAFAVQHFSQKSVSNGVVRCSVTRKNVQMSVKVAQKWFH